MDKIELSYESLAEVLNIIKEEFGFFTLAEAAEYFESFEGTMTILHEQDDE